MILIIDNYDSFTYNLYQTFCEVEEDVRVIRNDAVTIDEIADMSPSLVVLSPGPGTPGTAGISTEIVETFAGKIPLFGVCLGQQVIVEAFGGRVEKAEQPMHGKRSAIRTDQRTIFSQLPPTFSVTRYHSLCTPQKYLPSMFEVSALSEDRTVMGIRHILFPIEAVQFHPEAILTEHGKLLLQEAYNQALKWKGGAKGEVAVSI
ncbi:anthranilate synthase, component II [Salimicrobium halophilum]|uniref:Anthranilate synthase, component II n=2 Tax=Salimicrobium halophilum TaxID=86666 RepID=A0A1G8SWZ5_9BACI|nr:anthranilate synthase, component II [Salimicrobium halophilum]